MEVISLYEMEVPPTEIITFMKKNIYNHQKEESILNIDKAYTLQRKYLISLIQKISRKMGFKSQTYFLAVNYLDIIFSKNNDILYNYSLLAIGCLIIASKYCENVPLRPIFKYFVNLYNDEVKDENYKVTKEDLFKYEIIICKILNYKLNYFTIYDFNFFFFGNGIIKIEQLKEINYDINSITDINNSSSNINNSSQIKKILIKIYERSRHYLDVIIENLICLKYDSLLISICIMEKSIDYALLNEINIKKSDESIDYEQIQNNNKQYFKQIMKDYYKIDYEILPEYQDLKIDCENYKLFDDIYDNSISTNESNNLIKSQHMNNCKSNVNLIKENDSASSKKLNIIKDQSFKHSPSNNEIKNKKKFLYKKNMQVLNGNNKYLKYSIINIRNKNSPRKRTSTSRDNIFKFNEKINKNNNINSKKIITLNNFYKKNEDNYRASTSINKNNNYLKKSNTSSSPFRQVSNFNSSINNSKIIKKVKNGKRYDGSEEGLTTKSNSNSIEAKRNNFKESNIVIKNKNIKINKPYIKKVIQNYEKIQDVSKKNININININNKILYGGTIRHKDRNKSSKKIIVRNYLNRSNNSIIRGKSIVKKSRIENFAQKNGNNYESSPIYEGNTSPKFNYMPYKLNKRENTSKDKSMNHYNSKSIFLNNMDNNNIGLNNSRKNNNNRKYKTNYNIYNSSMTSRNSLQYPKNIPKLIDSFLNLKLSYLNKDINEQNLSTSMEYNNINNYISLNTLKSKNKQFNKRNNDNLNRTNNTIYGSNYVESYKNKQSKFLSNENDFNNSININLNHIKENNENYIFNNMNSDRRQKNFSNINDIKDNSIFDYSIRVSNQKDLY